MRTSATLLSLAAALGLVLASGTAAAQQVKGFALDRFDPAPTGSEWFVGDTLDIQGHLRFAAGGVLDCAYDPLVIYGPDGEVAREPVQQELVLHLNGSVVLWERLRLDANLPLGVATIGDTGFVEGTRVSVSEGASLGDLRVGATGRILGAPGGVLVLGAGVGFYLPTGDRTAFASDGKPRLALPRAEVAGDVGAFTYAAQAAIHVRTQGENFVEQPFGSEVTFAAAAGMRLLERRLVVGPELFASTVISDGGKGAFDRVTTPVEALIGAHYRPRLDWIVGAGLGTGLTRGLGAPKVRALLSVTWAPAAQKLPPRPEFPDTDGDGMLDVQDACPTVAGVRSNDPALNGCVPPPPDTDGDGIADPDDACVDQPGVANSDPKRNGCVPPPPDTDADGIADETDACVDEPGPGSDDPQKNGCPLPVDTDGDGTTDDVDACPSDAGVADPDPKKNGCPKAILEGEQVTILDQVQFDTGRARIRPESDSLLAAVAAVLAAHPELTKISVEGHTDNRGGAALNKTLSRARAAAVAQWLVDHGIDAKRVSSVGYGQDRPLGPNTTDENRQRNRRVEFHIVERDGKPVEGQK